MTVKKLYDEKVLFERVFNGDDVAFKIIFDLYKVRLYRYVFSVSKSEEVAEELVHDVFLKIWTHRHMLLDVDNPATYIYTIARNKALDYLRKAAREKKVLDQIWVGMREFHNDTEEIIEANESDKLIKQAINSLSAQKKMVYQLSRSEGLSHEQIAQKLNISKSTVNNHLVEAIKQIKAHLLKNSPETLMLLVLFNHFK